MSYYRELKDLVLEFKSCDFFLSPRDSWFLKFLEEEGYPLEVVREGIRKFFLFYPPEKRSKLPLSMSFGEIKKLNKHYLKRASPSKDWREKFRERLKRAEEILGTSLTETEPQDPKEAEEFLQSLEKRIATFLWEGLDKEERAKLMTKFKVFRKEEELFKAMIKRELFKRAGLKGLSLFLD
ncbi:MAG: hypothetical protein RMH93_01070 [Aquificaceae bacterium]|nr:hypothetical protein [Aquificaceae bacterium]MDW8032122.1 hypothetical protein [Aquificaceae bacterium]